MTGPPPADILAHHALLLAIPAFIPAIIVAGVVIYIAMRDRKSDAPHSENTESDRKDGSS